MQPAVLAPRTAEFSPLEQERREAAVSIPEILRSSRYGLETVPNTPVAAGGADIQARIQAMFPETVGQDSVSFVAGGAEQDTSISLRIGCVLSGGQASGGHNVIVGVFDWLQRMAKGPDTALIGFLDGPHGIFMGNYIELDAERISLYRNQGGFDMIGAGRHKIHDPEQFEGARRSAEQLNLDGILVIGGDDSNTNACMLGEYFQKHGLKTVVVGAPKTIDGDLKAVESGLETSFGFDSACKCYSECIGNIQTDCYASQKYYHFVRLMGRSASHIALECALQCHPNMCLIGEEVTKNSSSPVDIATAIADMIESRAAEGKHYGTVLVPEGLIEFFPSVESLITEINDALGNGTEASSEALGKVLSPEAAGTLASLPPEIQQQLILDRDPHGNVQVSAIETEVLLISMAGSILAERRAAGTYSGSFPAGAQSHFLGYEGRTLPPTLFDSSYCYALGSAAAVLVKERRNGYIAVIRNLNRSVSEWVPGGVPLTSMMTVERRLGKDKAVIRKALVELEQEPFLSFTELRETWAHADHYRNPGPVQYSGEVALGGNFTLASTDPQVTDLKALITNSDQMMPVTVTLGQYKETSFAVAKSLANFSPVQQLRLRTPPQSPALLSKGGLQLLHSAQVLDATLADAFPSTSQQPIVDLVDGDTVSEHGMSSRLTRVKRLKTGSGEATTPVRIGVVFCGRQNPAGHNIIAGLLDFVQESCPKGSALLGFLNGTKGMFKAQAVELGASDVELFVNQGGFDMLGRSSEQIKTDEQLLASLSTCQQLQLDGLVLVGGRHTLTDTATLAEYFAAEKSTTSVIVVPTSMERDIRHPLVETTIGFDTGTRVLASLVANIATDARSAKKYWWFIRLPGRDTSHVTLECAAKTRPNVVLLSEEVAQRGMNLRGVVQYLADVVCKRAAEQKNYGVVIIPEGLIQAIPELATLVKDLGMLMASGPAEKPMTVAEATAALSKTTPWSAALFSTFPPRVQQQLVLERDIHGTVQLSQIELERLLDELVSAELKRRKEAGQFAGKYSALCTNLGYQTRSALPSIFDANLGFTMGQTAAALIASGSGLSGLATIARGLARPVQSWTVGGVPVTSLMTFDTDAYEKQWEVEATPINLNGEPFQKFAAAREEWAMTDLYRLRNISTCIRAYLNPGSTQFGGSSASEMTYTLKEEQTALLSTLATIEEQCECLKRLCKLAYTPEILEAASIQLESTTSVLKLLMKKT